MKKAQASMEVTLSLICLGLILMGGLRIYLWSVEHVVKRQREYEKDRIPAVNRQEAIKPFLPKERKLPKLDIFAQEGIKSRDPQD